MLPHLFPQPLTLSTRWKDPVAKLCNAEQKGVLKQVGCCFFTVLGLFLEEWVVVRENKRRSTLQKQKHKVERGSFETENKDLSNC